MSGLDLVIGAFGVVVFFIVAAGMVLSMHEQGNSDGG